VTFKGNKNQKWINCSKRSGKKLDLFRPTPDIIQSVHT